MTKIIDENAADISEGENALMVMPEMNLPALSDVKEKLQGGFRSIYDKIEKEIEATPVDVSTKAGRKALISLAAKISRTKVGLFKSATQLTEDQKKLIAVVNAERKEMETTLEKMRDDVRGPVTAWENVEKERVETVQSAFALLRGIAATTHEGVEYADLNAAQLDDLAAHVAGKRPCDAETFQDAAENFNALSVTTETSIRERADAVRKSEADAAELAELRAKQEADEAARIEADRAAEQKRQDEERNAEAARVAQRAAQDKIDEEAKARADAERRAAEAEAERKAADERAETERVEAEKRAAEREAELKREADEREARNKAKAEQDAADAKAQAERDRKQAVHDERERAQKSAAAEKAAEDARAADIEHRRAINASILKAMVAASDVDEATAKVIIQAVAKFQIPHLKIEY